MAIDRSHLTMTSPVGDLEPVALHATEAISTPFVFTVDVVSDEQGLNPDRLLSHPACVTLNIQDAPPRHFHGIIRTFHAGGINPRGCWRYTAELVPELWFAGQTQDCRVFHSISVVGILEQLFAENAIKSTRIAVQGERRVRDFTVQYNETVAAILLFYS